MHGTVDGEKKEKENKSNKLTNLLIFLLEFSSCSQSQPL